MTGKVHRSLRGGPSGALGELASERLDRLLLRYSWPALVAMTLNALYTVVDRVFIGQGCGVDAMAGIQLAMPVMMLFTAFGVFVGAGHSAVLSIKLGEGNRTACEKLVGQLVAFKVVTFFVLAPLVFFNLDTVLGWCGANRVTPGACAAAKDYLRLVLFSHFFAQMAFGLAALQRAEGGARRSMMSMIVGFGLNLVLDPIFIFGVPASVFGGSPETWLVRPHGVVGAAWATNIAMFCSCLWALGYYLRGRTVVRLNWRTIGFHRGLVFRPAAIGVAPFLQHLMSSLIVASLQVAFATWMPTEASRTAEIASVGVFNGALLLVFMPMLGCQQGLQPIFGYNWGARNFHRVLGALKLGFAVTTALCVFAFVIQVVPPFPTWLARMFVSSENPDVIALAAHDLALSNCMIWCISINVVATTYFMSIGRPAVAISLSMLRQGVVLLPIIWLLPHVLDDKAMAIWLSMPISDVVCNLATIPPLLSHVRFLRRCGRGRGLLTGAHEGA